MIHHEGSFVGPTGTKIYYQCWLPMEEPRVVLLVSHGLAEHSGRYMNIVDRFVPRGYAVYACDYPGHGRSAGRRAYVHRFADFTAVLYRYLGMVHAWQPGRPVFLIGHSMGALIGAAFLLKHQSELAGAVLSGPSVGKPPGISRGTIIIGMALSVLAPRLGVTALDAHKISRDPAVVQAYVNDPLVYTGKITARLGAELLREMQRVAEAAPAITLPIMIVQGGADGLVDPNGARMLYRTVGSADKTLKIYDGFYHEVFNDPGHERVLDDVAAWLEAHL